MVNRFTTFALGLAAFCGVSSVWYCTGDLSDEEQTVFWTLAPLFLLDAVFVAASLAVSDRIQRFLFKLALRDGADVNLRDSVRSNWTNTAMVSALVATMAAAAWMLDVPAEDMFDPRAQLFATLAAQSTLFSMLGTLFATLSLLFTDGMSDGDLRVLLKDCNSVVGLELMCLFASLLSLFAALGLRNHILYGRGNTFVILLLTLGACLSLSYFVRSFTLSLQKLDLHTRVPRRQVVDASIDSAERHSAAGATGLTS